MAAETSRPVILWFRRDLRLGDNPALASAIDTGWPILPVYILGDSGEGRRHRRRLSVVAGQVVAGAGRSEDPRRKAG